MQLTHCDTILALGEDRLSLVSVEQFYYDISSVHFTLKSYFHATNYVSLFLCTVCAASFRYLELALIQKKKNQIILFSYSCYVCHTCTYTRYGRKVMRPIFF